MHTHYLNNSIGDSEELVEHTNRNNLKRKTAQLNQKYNSGRFQYSSQEGNPNYSSLSNSDFPDEKQSNRQRNRVSAVNYHQQRKVKSKTSKGYYKSTVERSDFKSNSKSKKRKISKRNRSSKNHETAQTPISMTKIAKSNNFNDFTMECESIASRKRRKTQGAENVKHQKNISDNSIMYTSHSCGPNIQELLDAKVTKQTSTGVQPSYSPYVSNNANNRKASQRSKSTNPNIASNPQNKVGCAEGFVNIDLSQLPHDMTQREVVETMIRKNEISNFMYSDEDEDTSRYIMQNPDDRRTCRRSQCNKKTEIVEDLANPKESVSPINFHKKIVLGSKSNSIALKTASIDTEDISSTRVKDSFKGSLVTEEIVQKLVSSMSENLKCLEECDRNKSKAVTTNNSHEKKFFLYCNVLDDLAAHFPKLKSLLNTVKEGFQTSIRNIVANELKEKGLRESNRILKERENLSRIQKGYDDRGVIIEEQEDIIEGKDSLIRSLKQENQNLQKMLEKHRVNGIKLQDENDHLRAEVERLRKIEEDALER